LKLDTVVAEIKKALQKVENYAIAGRCRKRY